MLIILIVLLVIGYAARALDGSSRPGSLPAGPHPAAGPVPAAWRAGAAQDGTQPVSTAHRGGRLAAKAAMPSCACGPAK